MMTLGQTLNYPSQPMVNYNKDHYKTSIIGTSDCNEYIPYYSLFAHDLISIHNTDIRVMEYAMPKIQYMTSSYRAFTYLTRFFTGVYNQGMQFPFTVQGVSHHVYVSKGMIMDHTGEILVCVGINKEYAMNTPYNEIKTIDPTKYVLFISNKLNDAIYKNFKKRLEKDLFPIFSGGNVDIVFTNRINEWLFKNNFKQPKFKSVKESAQHLKEVSKLFLKV